MGESFYQQLHRFPDGAVMVYRRADTNQQVYQTRLKIPGVTGYVTAPSRPATSPPRSTRPKTCSMNCGPNRSSAWT